MNWHQKYAPKTLDDVILPPRIKNALSTMRTHHYSEHLLFSGATGVGKTTTATVLSPRNTDLLNVAMDRKVEDVDHIKKMLHSRNLFEPATRRIVVVDEADHFSAAMQKALKGILDGVPEADGYGRLVITSNNPMNLIAPLRSRLYCIDFNLTPEELAMVSDQFRRRLCEIADAEGFTAENEVIDAAMRYAPDFRKVIQTFAIESLTRQCAPDSQASRMVTARLSIAQESQVQKQREANLDIVVLAE